MMVSKAQFPPRRMIIIFDGKNTIISNLTVKENLFWDLYLVWFLLKKKKKKGSSVPGIRGLAQSAST